LIYTPHALRVSGVTLSCYEVDKTNNRTPQSTPASSRRIIEGEST
jgi:hypothetical protein